MIKELWINLPVKDVNKSRDFFTRIGFTVNEKYGNSATSASLLAGSKSIVIMLFAEPLFTGLISGELADTKKGNEVLFSIDAQSREEVDDMANKVTAAGGIVFAKPGDKDGWMYGCGFSDPDGHKWNVLYMDMSKMPK